MKATLNITVQEPCHENWQQMTAVQKGRFCSACQKKVTDFTKSTDREIIQAFTNDTKLCGRFLNTQLERELLASDEKKSIWLASIMFGMLSLSGFKSNAQSKTDTSQTPIKHIVVGKPAMHIERTDTVTKGKKMSGIVSDASGPLPAANVAIKGTSIAVQTNFDGTYTIDAKEGDVLVFSFMGMKEVTKTVGISRIMNVILENEAVFITEPVVIMGTVSSTYVKKRTFVGRQLETIGNFFK